MKLKSLHIQAILLAGLVIGSVSCKKLPDGFISDLIRYEEDPIIIQQGRVKVSTALNFDGSSKPAQIKLIHIYDAGGNIVDDIFAQTYPIKAWKGQYDPKTDTTLELIAAKQVDMDVPPLSINPVSGQLEANFTTLYIPTGSYSFDLQITNAAGTKTYPQVGHFDIVEAKPYEAIPEQGTAYNQLRKVGDENTSKNIGVPSLTINRVADEPNVVVVRFLDKNGVPFNPAAGEVIRRPQPGLTTGSLQTLQDYALKTELFSDRFEFTFPVTPFPLISLGNGFNIYYRIPTQFVHYDDPTLPDNTWSSNPRFPLRIFVPGKYTVDMQFPDLTHR